MSLMSKCLMVLAISYVFIFDNCVNGGSGPYDIPGPFTNPTLNLVLYGLCVVIIILLVMMCCCILCCYCCRKPEDDKLEVTPSELVAIGATPSDLKAAKISPSVLKESGATYDQMAELGATPSQLVEAGAGKEDLERLGATPSQLSHVGYKEQQNQRSSPKAVSEAQSEVLNVSTTKPKDNEKDVKTVSQKRFNKKSSHNMSQVVDEMAQKLKNKPKKSPKPSIQSSVHSTAPSAQPTKAPADDTISTVSVSPQKKAAALKTTDDSMSLAMGPPSKQ